MKALPRTSFSQLEESARHQPEMTAIDGCGQPISFRELHRAVLSLAGYMQQHLEVRGGDHVLLLMPECPQRVMACQAIQRCGAVVVALSSGSTAGEIGQRAQGSGARVLMAAQEGLPRIEPLLESGRLAGCILAACDDWAGSARKARWPPDSARHARVHGFMDALAAGIDPRPMDARVAREETTEKLSIPRTL